MHVGLVNLLSERATLRKAGLAAGRLAQNVRASGAQNNSLHKNIQHINIKRLFHYNTMYKKVSLPGHERTQW